MRCLVFAIAILFTGCSTFSHLGSGGSGDARGPGPSAGSETAIVWLDGQGAFPSVGYFDVQTIFNENELGPGSYVRVAALHVTGTSRTALIGKLRLRASQIGANRLLIVKAEVTKEEVYLYSDLEESSPVLRRREDGRGSEQRSIHAPDRRGSPSDNRMICRPCTDPVQGMTGPPCIETAVHMIGGRPCTDPAGRMIGVPYIGLLAGINRPSAYQPPRRDDRPPESPPPPKDDRPPEKAPPARDEQPDVKPPPPPPEDKRPSPLKRPRMKTHQP